MLRLSRSYPPYTANCSCISQASHIQALITALQHPAVELEPCDLCSLLQTCHSWRSAIQQSAATIITAYVSVCENPRKLSAFASFAAWMQKHAGLLESIKLHAPNGEWHGITAQDYCSAVDNMLTLAMRATLVGRAPSLQLKAFSTDHLGRASVLEALPANTLPHLSFVLISGSCSPRSTAVAGALTRLTGLQQLQMAYPISVEVSIQ